MNRSRRFYEGYFWFRARPPRRYPDGVLTPYDSEGFALAPGPAEGPPRLPRFFHVGFAMADRSEVLTPRERLRAEGIEIVEDWDEPNYRSLNCRDSMAYVIEAAWEVPP